MRKIKTLREFLKNTSQTKSPCEESKAINKPVKKINKNNKNRLAIKYKHVELD